MGRLLVEWYNTQSNVKLDGFRFKRPTCLATLKCCDTTKQSILGWLYIFFFFWLSYKDGVKPADADKQNIHAIKYL